MITYEVMTDSRSDEIRWNDNGSLVKQLVECVLAICSRFAPDNGPRAIGNLFAIAVNALAIAFHVPLLKVRRKAMHILVVRQYRLCLHAKEIDIPGTDQGHQYRNI